MAGSDGNDAAAKPAADAGAALYQRARAIIPGGSQLLSKRPERFCPTVWPAYYERAEGCTVWGLGGTAYKDMSYNGLGACVLGYRDPDVDEAVQGAIRAGVATTLNCPEEVELAERLLHLHPWAGGVRYARTGGEAMAMAVRIARAHTRRDKIAFCGYHGWHDWYLAANLADDSALDGHLLPGLSPAGVPRGLTGTALPFRYGARDELQAILEKNPGQVAAVVMEPLRDKRPPPGFLEEIREMAHAAGALLVFDEVTAGLRLGPGGAHLTLGVTPDIAVFAKAIGNGYAMAAVVGTEDAMAPCHRTFISSTAWTERIGPTAALATLTKFEEQKVHRHLIAIGKQVQSGWQKAADEAGLSIHVGGIEPLGHFQVDAGDAAEAAHTLYTTAMLEEGYLANNSFYATLAHQPEAIQDYLDATRRVFGSIARGLETGRILDALPDGVRQSGFARLA